jgi:hypothetical protein
MCKCIARFDCLCSIHYARQKIREPQRHDEAQQSLPPQLNLVNWWCQVNGILCLLWYVFGPFSGRPLGVPREISEVAQYRYIGIKKLNCNWEQRFNLTMYSLRFVFDIALKNVLFIQCPQIVRPHPVWPRH